MTRVAILIATFVLVLLPDQVMAHAVERGLIQLLPTKYYLAGGGAAVAISFLIIALVPAGLLKRVATWSIPLPSFPQGLGVFLQWLSFAAFACLLLAGFFGPIDPLRNLLPLSFWVVCWIGIVVLSALAGDIWRWLNLWSAPVRWVRRRFYLPAGALPRWAEYWPALASLWLIFWFDLVSLAPEDPGGLARAFLIYWAIHFLAMLYYGERWRQRGEGLSVFFHFLSRIAPEQEGRIQLPGAALITMPALPVAGWLFACLMIAGVTADGLFGTFWWLDLIGVNPLDFPGRSAVMAENTAGLFVVWTAMTAGFAGSVALGWVLVGQQDPLGPALGRLALSLLPIALAYHLSHFLVYLLINGQYALVALSDPLGTGSDWLGLGPHFVTTSFMNTMVGIMLIWRVQVVMIVGGHLAAVLIAHMQMLGLCGDHRKAMIAGLPLGLLMVGYTVLGLWLLSTPTGA